jgi:sugar phosphate isomerase/epimerase
MMNILLHTIAIEPARWTPQRVSQPLTDLISRIAEKTGFTQLEIFEPHLTLAPDPRAIRDALAHHNLQPVVLSSYLDIARLPAEDFPREAASLLDRARFFGFKKVRLFPGPGIAPDDARKAGEFTERLAHVANSAPDIEFLLETHDGSLADDPERVVIVVESAGCENVGLLWQSTFFETEQALRQFEIQKHLVRHFHLQNRSPDKGFTTLERGIVPWPKILAETQADASLEFVPGGICSVQDFDLDRTLAEAESEAAYARSLDAAAQR